MFIGYYQIVLAYFDYFLQMYKMTLPSRADRRLSGKIIRTAGEIPEAWDALHLDPNRLKFHRAFSRRQLFTVLLLHISLEVLPFPEGQILVGPRIVFVILQPTVPGYTCLLNIGLMVDQW